MKTFDEVKETVKYYQSAYIERAQTVLKNNPDLDNYQVDAKNNLIKLCSDAIEHLDEAAVIEIGYNTNKVIEGMLNAYRDNAFVNYNGDFDRFIRERIVGLTGDNKRIPKNLFYEQDAFFNLGLSVSDYKVFDYTGKQIPDHKQFLLEAGEKFKQRVNENFGTSIPSLEEEQAIVDRENNSLSLDEFEQAKALVAFKEANRDSGRLKKGITYDLLENDEAYLKAKEIVNGRSL